MLHAGLPVPHVIRPLICAGYRCGVFVTESLILLRKIVWIEPVLRSVCEQVGVALRADRLPYMRGSGEITIGDHVNLSGRSCFYFVGTESSEIPRIVVGNNVFIGNACTLSAASRIEVGNHCLISAEVRIHDNDGHPLDSERRRDNGKITADEVAPVVLEDNVWIGAGATVLKGVTIGENSVIGTGAVITKDVPRDSIAVGNPARIAPLASRPKKHVEDETGA